MIDKTEAVRLAAEALHREACLPGCVSPVRHAAYHEPAATAAVTAALPALAEQFAALIETRCRPTYHQRCACAVCAMISTAARLVREAAEVTG